jgi:alcohol dehydrogenase class IV
MEKLALIAQRHGVNTAGADQCDAALAAAEAVEALMKRVGHPLSLREAGVAEASLLEYAMHAISDSAVLFSSKIVTDLEDVIALFQQSY